MVKANVYHCKKCNRHYLVSNKGKCMNCNSTMSVKKIEAHPLEDSEPSISQMVGFFIALLTFPGVILHEFSHKKFCDWFGVKVLKVKYFGVPKGNGPLGYVVHEKPKKFRQTFFISTGPFMLNSIFAILFYFLYFIIPVPYLFAWLGFSSALHAFPSSGDAYSLWYETKRHMKDNILAVVGFPIAILIWIANGLSMVWFDVMYAGLLFFLSEYWLSVLLL
jgi:hypothetical protein